MSELYILWSCIWPEGRFFPIINTNI